MRKGRISEQPTKANGYTAQSQTQGREAKPIIARPPAQINKKGRITKMENTMENTEEKSTASRAEIEKLLRLLNLMNEEQLKRLYLTALYML